GRRRSCRRSCAQGDPPVARQACRRPAAGRILPKIEAFSVQNSGAELMPYFAAWPGPMGTAGSGHLCLSSPVLSEAAYPQKAPATENIASRRFAPRAAIWKSHRPASSSRRPKSHRKFQTLAFHHEKAQIKAFFYNSFDNPFVLPPTFNV